VPGVPHGQEDHAPWRRNRDCAPGRCGGLQPLSLGGSAAQTSAALTPKPGIGFWVDVYLIGLGS